MNRADVTDALPEQRLVALMTAYQGGDLRAFEALYAALANDVRRRFARAGNNGRIVDDLVQETFLEVHRARRTYAPPLPVRPWIFGIARNVAARSRRAARHAQLQRAFDEAVPAPQADVPRRRAEALDLERALATLPAGTREPWLLHHLFGFSFRAIAERLGISVVAAKLRSSRATRALRIGLGAGPGSCDD
jgi:RNA polymerase sigma-70 factor, ECF subfamily